jgi:putative PIN family toxin of toxin-antitoxin system
VLKSFANDSIYAIIPSMPIIVLDTNILVAALLRGGGSARSVLRRCIDGHYQAVLGPALLAEYEDVLGRTSLFANSVLSEKERDEVFDGFLSGCRWVEVFYAWRPNLPDEADNHLVELGVAAQADAIVTRNLRDLSRGELKFPMLRVLTPEQCLEVFPCPR